MFMDMQGSWGLPGQPAWFVRHVVLIGLSLRVVLNVVLGEVMCWSS